MSHVLVDRLTDELGYVHVTLENHDDFVAEPGMNVLFFPGDPVTVKDATDVAVVLPELAAATGGVLQPAVVTTEAEIPLQKVYGFRAWPSLVFTRPEGYLGRISRMKDWSEYLEQLDDILRAVPHSPPGFDRPTPPPRGEQGVQTEVR